jgi:L-2-hydroxyglutarate oxidase LhgO
VKDKADYLSQKTPPGFFVEALRRFLPVLEESDLRWGYSGIRPCVMIGQHKKSDFIVSVDRETPLLINLVGIESPGLSAALALARHVSDLPCIQQHFRPMGSSAVTHRL